MATVADQRLEARALLRGRVAVKLDLAIIVSRGDDLLSAFERAIRPVGMVDVRAILTGLPATRHGPGENAALRVPQLVSVVRGAARDLEAFRDRVVENLVGAVICTDSLRVHAPVNVRDEARTATELLDPCEGWDGIQVDLVVVGADGQVLTIGRELEVFDPLLRDLLHVGKLPVAYGVYTEVAVAQADGAMRATWAHIDATTHGALIVLLGSSVLRHQRTLGILEE